MYTYSYILVYTSCNVQQHTYITYCMYTSMNTLNILIPVAAARAMSVASAYLVAGFNESNEVYAKYCIDTL